MGLCVGVWDEGKKKEVAVARKRSSAPNRSQSQTLPVDHVDSGSDREKKSRVRDCSTRITKPSIRDGRAPFKGKGYCRVRVPRPVYWLSFLPFEHLATGCVLSLLHLYNSYDIANDIRQ